VAEKWGANLKLVESPPGPPVISTIAVEIYGEPTVAYPDLERGAAIVAGRLEREPLVTDVDTSVEARPPRWRFLLDKEKAALSGIATEDVAWLSQVFFDGMPVARLHAPHEANPLEMRLHFPRALRSSTADLLALYVKGRPGYVQRRVGAAVEAAPIPVVPLGELGAFSAIESESAIYHKNLQRVAYVFADTAGRAPAEVILDVSFDEGSDEASGPARSLGERSYFANGGGDGWQLPQGVRAVWTGEGEWQITLDVFRDLGIAFGVACLGIYVLLIYQTSSYFMPLILMISIPLTVIGIMPGFWLLNAVATSAVGDLPNPVFFTATAMIGMIALSGIAVRNAILLIEFVHERLREGIALRDALLASGAVRLRPIFLTAGTAILAAWPITLDPIFSGLAWALIFGLFVSTVFTLVVIPVTYDLVYRHRAGHGVTIDEA
jgi:multidrug efflux pump subunit AcrB